MEQEFRGGLDLSVPQNDPRDFNLDVLGAWFGGYTPKSTRVILPTLSTKNQGPQNSCVPESAAQQKEVDEGVVLSPQGLAAYLMSKGQMNEAGTSLIAAQKAMVDFGFPEWDLLPNNHNVPFQEFADPKLLTPEVVENAAKHKAGSFWRTDTLDTVLRQIDLVKEGKLKNAVGQTGALWYTGYNPSQLKAPFVIQRGAGVFAAGHGFNVVGYDLNYHGLKVVACKTTFGGEIYDDEIFYIKFEDFNKVLEYGVYYTLDIPRNIAEWLNKNANKAILEKNSPKVWVVEDGKRRYVPNEAMMWMLDITPSELVVDAENYLGDLPEGEAMSLKDIPLEKQEHIKYLVQMAVTPGFLSDRFKTYYPDLFKK